MNNSEVISIFKKSGAVLEGHFLLASGLHSPVYWEKFRVLQHPELAIQLCQMIATKFKGSGAQLVAGPTTGGIILAFEIARQMGLRAIFAEKNSGKRIFRRGLSINQGEKVLVVDDILTTGGSLEGVIQAVKEAGGEVTGIGVLVDRSTQSINFKAPLYSCLKSESVTYIPENCPLCQKQIPLVRPGS